VFAAFKRGEFASVRQAALAAGVPMALTEAERRAGSVALRGRTSREEKP
jgi:hypothetical protein